MDQLLPAGRYSALRILGAAHHGDVQSSATISYSDGTSAQVPIALTDWAAGSGHNGNTVAIATAHRIKANSGIDGPPVQIFGTALPLDPNKSVLAITLPDNSHLEIYAATLVA